MKERKLTIMLEQDDINALARIGARAQIGANGQAERFVMAGLECGDLVHRIDPHGVQTLCGAEGGWRAVNTAMGVTCPRCMELLYKTLPTGTDDRTMRPRTQETQ